MHRRIDHSQTITVPPGPRSPSRPGADKENPLVTRKTGAAAIAVAAALTLAACSSGSAGGDSSEGGDVELTMLAATYSDNTKVLWDEVIADFEAENPGVTVELEMQSWENINDVIRTRVQS